MLGALVAGLGPGCSLVLSFSNEVEVDASRDAPFSGDDGAPPDVVGRPGDGAVADAEAADAVPCLASVAFVDPGGRCYMIFDDASGWEAARASCEALGSNAHLLVIGSAEENALLAPLLGEAQRWTAFTDVSIEANWVWYGGEPVTYTNWRTGEPNNGGVGGIPENCGVIEGKTGALWDDRACDGLYGRICERD